MLELRKCRIGVAGLGYVGLPLEVKFDKHFQATDFDLSTTRDLEVGRKEFAERR